jgi:hypothetical protein
LLILRTFLWNTAPGRLISEAGSYRILGLKGDGEFRLGQRPGSRLEVRGVCSLSPFAFGVTAAALMAGCHAPAADPSAAKTVDPASYVTPPVLTQAAGLADGGATLSGRAPPDAEVLLRSPTGDSFSAEAGPDGAWSIGLPPAEAPRMFAFEATVSRRVVHGEGAILVLPSQEAPAALLRAGDGALPIGHGDGRLRIAALDYDDGGGGSVSGFAKPGSAVRFMLDGQPAGGGEADSRGEFSLLDLSVRMPFSVGPHTIRLDQGGESLVMQVAVKPAKLGQDAFRAARDGDAWRIDWRVPGGGAQTTLVFDPPIGAAS